MKPTRIRGALRGELALAVQPPLTPSVEADWRRRLHLTTGRSLSHLALSIEQEGHAGRAALLGQGASPGVVFGLEVTHASAADGRPLITISPGFGLTASGEDVQLPKRLDAALGELPVDLVDSVTTLDQAVAEGRALAPVLALVLRPALVEVLNRDDADPCEPAREDRAFEDRTRVDAARLVLVPWPVSEGAPPARDEAWRNATAHAVFQRERERPELGPLGLAADGLPLALVGIELPPADGGRAWEVRFLDRQAVRRLGGRRRRRGLPGLLGGSSALARARVDQLSEELAELAREHGPGADGKTLLESMRARLRLLPPVGVLPKEVLDLAARRSGFFDDELQLDVVPAPLEQLDTLARPSMGLDPIDLGAADRVRLVVPVPQAVYEPGLLETPEVDPEFWRALSEIDLDRRAWRTRRGELRAAASELSRLTEGHEVEYPEPDPDAVGDVGLPPDVLDPDAATEGLEERLASERFAIQPKPEELSARMSARVNPLEVELRRLNLAVVPEDGGLPALIETLEARIATNRDKVETGFVRASGDLYRTRQYLLGNQAATRMATSEALSHVAEGLHVKASRRDLGDYYERFAKAGVARSADVEAAEGTASVSASTHELFQKPLSSAAYGSGKSLRADVLEGMLSAGLQFDDELEIPGFQQKEAAAGQPDRWVDKSLRFGKLREGVVEEIRRGQHDNLRDERDETELFRASTRAFDATLAILRIWEGRIRDYEKLLGHARKVQADLRELARTVDSELERLDGELAETRHDLRVALALLAEEKRRIAELTERRGAILERHFRFLFFYRPRSLEAGSEDLLVRTLLPGDLRDTIAECREESDQAPQDVVDMVGLWGDAPVRWFPQLRGLLAELPRLPTLVDLVGFAKWRATAFGYAPNIPAPTSPSLPPMQLASPLPSPWGPQVLAKTAVTATTVLQAQKQVVATARSVTASIDLGALQALPWSAVRKEAEAVVSVSDLTEGKHGSARARVRASEFLRGVQGAGACLHESVGRLPVVVRLEWTRRVSELDRVRTLRDLSRLPAWERIENEVHQVQLQRLVDGLYDLVDESVPEAVSLVTDLVRVAILAASHAPVGTILAGHVRVPTAVSVGGLVPVVPKLLDLAKIGMAVHFYKGAEVVAQGLIEDALGDHVSVRVLDLPPSLAGPRIVDPLRGLPEFTVDLDAGTQVQFAALETLPVKLLPSKLLGAAGGLLTGMGSGAF